MRGVSKSSLSGKPGGVSTTLDAPVDGDAQRAFHHSPGYSGAEYSGTGVRADRLALAMILLIGLIHGLLYLTLVPPWQHYDEPNHFEVVWLVANRALFPAPRDSDPGMNRQVVESMVRHGFYRGTGVPDLQSSDPLRIGGYSQIGEAPLYYWLAAIPVAAARTAGIDAQLYLARFNSLLLYLLSLTAAWGVTRELTSEGSPLRLLAPLCLTLLPAYADVMTSVNNDVGAVAAFAFFLWGGVRLVKSGLRGGKTTLLNLLWTLGAALACAMMKTTVLLALPLALIAVGLAAWPRSPAAQRVVVVVGLGVAAFFLVLVFDWGDPAGWARGTFQESAGRVRMANLPSGRYAFAISPEPPVVAWLPSRFAQLLPPSKVEPLAHGVVTLGAWMWADRPTVARTPILNTYSGGLRAYREVTLTRQPQFFAFPVTLRRDTGRVWVELQGAAPESGATVYFEGLALAQGEFPPDSPPQFSDETGKEGTWSGQIFTNLLANPSAERGGLRLRPWVDRLGFRFLPDRGNNLLSVSLYVFQDVPATGQFTAFTAATLFRSFWARFGWGHVPLLGSKPYRPLLALTLIGLLGASAALWRLRNRLAWKALVFLGAAAGLVWAQTLLRGSNYLLQAHWVYTPVARYVFPAAIPVLLLLSAGWAEPFRRLEQRRNLNPQWKFLALGAVFAGLAIYALISLVVYYR